MPQIVPISHLKNTSEISEMCHSTKEPIFITKNGYGDMVLMSMVAGLSVESVKKRSDSQTSSFGNRRNL